MKLEVKGLEALTKKFDKLSKESQKEVNAALEAWADDVASNAKLLVPVDTGRLKNSITPQYGNGYAMVKVSANYAAYVEFGTRKMASQYVPSLPQAWQDLAETYKRATGKEFTGMSPRPYLYPSVNKYTPILLQDLKDIFKI